MTRKQTELFNLLIHTNKSAKLNGRPYLRQRATIEEICSDELLTNETIDAILEDEYIETIQAPGYIPDEDADTMSEILWAIYLGRDGNTKNQEDPKPARRTWGIMRAALLELANQRGREPFVLVLQGPATNMLPKAFLAPYYLDDEGARICSIDSDITYRLKAVSENQIEDLRTTAYILLLFLQAESAKQRKRDLLIPLEEYARARKVKLTEDFKNNVVKDLKALKAISYEYMESPKGKNVYKSCGSVDLCGGVGAVVGGVKKGVIRWSWSPDAYHELEELAPMDIMPAIFSAKPKDYTFYMGRYIFQNYRYNEDKILKGNNVIKIRTLIEYISNYPDAETIANKIRNRQTHLLVEKFWRDLDKLDNIYYDVFTKDGNLVTDPMKMSYQDFLNGYIVVDYSEFPKHPERIEQKEKKAKQKRTRRLKN